MCKIMWRTETSEDHFIRFENSVSEWKAQFRALILRRDTVDDRRTYIHKRQMKAVHRIAMLT